MELLGARVEACMTPICQEAISGPSLAVPSQCKTKKMFGKQGQLTTQALIKVCVYESCCVSVSGLF